MANLVITTGGASVGDKDLIKEPLMKLMVKNSFGKLKLNQDHQYYAANTIIQ